MEPIPMFPTGIISPPSEINVKNEILIPLSPPKEPVEITINVIGTQDVANVIKEKLGGV